MRNPFDKLPAVSMQLKNESVNLKMVPQFSFKLKHTEEKCKNHLQSSSESESCRRYRTISSSLIYTDIYCFIVFYFIVFVDIIFFFTNRRFMAFLHRGSLSADSISRFFPSAFAQFVSLCCIFVILQYFKKFFNIIKFVVVICEQGSLLL